MLKEAGKVERITKIQINITSYKHPLGFSNFAGSAGVTKSLPKIGGNSNQDIC